MDRTAEQIARRIAGEINARPAQVDAAVKLLDEGATVPFVARYRKEATGGLDDSQLRTLADRLVYLRELEARRGVILQSIRDQGKLGDDLARAEQNVEALGEGRRHAPGNLGIFLCDGRSGQRRCGNTGAHGASLADK